MFFFLLKIFLCIACASGWFGSRVVSVLDSGAEGPRVQIAVVTLSGNSLRQTVHTHCASVHQAVKLVAALLRVAGVTAGLAESNGSLPTGQWRQREFKVGGTNHRMGWGVGEEVASYSRMKSA